MDSFVVGNFVRNFVAAGILSLRGCIVTGLCRTESYVAAQILVAGGFVVCAGLSVLRLTVLQRGSRLIPGMSRNVGYRR